MPLPMELLPRPLVHWGHRAQLIRPLEMDDWREHLGGRRCLAARALDVCVIGMTRQGWDAKKRDDLPSGCAGFAAGFRRGVPSCGVRKNLVRDGGEKWCARASTHVDW